MMDLLARIVVWLNALANAVGWVLLAPLAALPGWLSATLVSVASGVLLLLVFKYTSNQRAIRRVRNDINAHLLALKLFKDSAAVAVHAQGRLLVGAGRLLVLGVVPMLVMVIPVCLLLGQLALWYQARPLHVGEEAVITMTLNGAEGSTLPEVRLEPGDGVEVLPPPVRIPSKREVCWQVRARGSGYHRLAFHVDGQVVEKELAVGTGFMRVSARRPGWRPDEALLHPWEPPFRPDARVRSIEVAYPQRASWTSGTDYWMLYWFAVSMLAGFCCRRWVNVQI